MFKLCFVLVVYCMFMLVFFELFWLFMYIILFYDVGCCLLSLVFGLDVWLDGLLEDSLLFDVCLFVIVLLFLFCFYL